MKPVLIRDVSIKPFLRDDVSCESCEKRAKWLIGSTPLCASCFLYETTWGRAHKEGIEKLIQSLEERLGEVISEGGKVVEGHADRIVGSIAMASRMAIIFEARREVTDESGRS